MKFLSVLKWTIALTLAAVLSAGVAGFYFFNRKDDLVQTEIEKRFGEFAPELQLHIGSARLNGVEGATLQDIEIRERKTNNPLFLAKELRVDIDSHQLVEYQQVVIESLRLTGAEVLVVREEDGRWNWQNYDFEPPPRSSGVPPSISIDDMAIQLTLRHGGGIPPARLVLRKSRLQAVPASAQSWDFDGSVDLPGAGPLRLTGACDLKSQKWNLSGHLRDVEANHDLMQLAKDTTPQLNDHLDRLDVAIERALPAPSGQLPGSGGAALQIGNNSRVAPQFLGRLDVDFAVSGRPDAAVPDFKLLVNVRDGRLATPAIPFALTNVQAKFFRDNNSLVFRLDGAEGNDASLRGGFEMQTGENAAPGEAWFDVKRFPVTAQLKPLLPPRTLRLFHAFQPDLVVSASGRILQSEDGQWKPHEVRAEVAEGTALFHRFQFPAEDIAATLVQRPYQERSATVEETAITTDDVVFDVEVSGRFGEHNFRSTGWWKNPGPRTETRFRMSVKDFPLDSRFRNALGDKEQSVFDSLNLSGETNADFVFYRPPGMDQPTHTFLDARVSDAQMRFHRFSYAIDNLSGHLTYNSATRHWKFHRLEGEHGPARISAQGEFRGDLAPGVLDLTVTAKNAPLDSDLYNALARNQRSVWNMVNPDGYCDLTAQINWTAGPGQPAVVSFPKETPVRIYDTKIRPTPFPYDMLIDEAFLSFDPNDPLAAGSQHCEIHSFRATHKDAPIEARGWAEIKADDEWQVHLNNVTAVNLQPDDALRAALPASWRQTLSRVHHAGLVSIRNSEMDFRGDIAGQRNTTARWDLNLEFSDCTLNAGLDVEHVYGGLTAKGVWDGFRLRNVGDFEIDTAEVLEMPFTNIHGPYSLNDVELVLGSRRVFETDSTLSQVDRTGRVRAFAYGGELVLDAHVDLREGGRYQFFTELADAKLESYAALHIPDQRDLKGVITAWLSLEGTGEDAQNLKGRGQLLINPAALYEIPVIVKLLGSLSQLNLNVQDRTAFNYALLDYDVGDEAFWFKSIDLVGEAISFRGRGSVGFGGAVDLDFYSRPARSRAAALPFISGMFTNWAKVEVRGTTDRPQTIVRSAARLDEGLRQFLQPFNPNPSGPIPGLNVPQFFQRTGPLLQRRRMRNAAQAPSTAN